jgi:signal transduction histidine kinase
MAAMPYVRAFFIVRPDGHVLASARVFPIDKSLDLFALAPIHPQNDKDTHFLGAVAPGVRDEKGTLIFPIGTRVKDDTGDVVALVIAILNPVYFTDFYKTVDVGGAGHIGLWTSAGQLVAKNANTPTLIGSLDPAIERYIANMDRRVKPGELTAYTSRAGGVAQIDAYARVEDLPLHVLVSNTDYLAGWRDTRNRFALAVTALVSAMLACAIIILRQVERSRANEEALRHAKAVAEEANEAKSRFLAHMSHEFRTPLNAIMGFADIIRSKVMGEHISPVYASYADHIHRSGEHLLNIVNDVLDMAKIESGMQSIQHTTVDVAGVVARSISFVEQMAQQYSLILRTLRTPGADQSAVECA